MQEKWFLLVEFAISADVTTKLIYCLFDGKNPYDNTVNIDMKNTNNNTVNIDKNNPYDNTVNIDTHRKNTNNNAVNIDTKIIFMTIL